MAQHGAAQPRACIDVLRAGLGCLLFLVQARTALTSLSTGGGLTELLSKDWGFATALFLHLGWLLSCVFGGWASSFYWCTSRIAPKVALLAQLLAQREVPATACWFVGVHDRQYKKWCWEALAEVFVYTCGELPVTLVLRTWTLDAIWTVLIWACVYSLLGVHPTPAAAAAYLLLRQALALGVHLCQRRANFRWLWGLLPKWRQQPSYLQQLAAKAHNPTYDVLRAHTPVYSSILCCNDPAMLSHIASTASKDLEPVHLERLSSCGPGESTTQSPVAGRLSPSDATGGAASSSATVGGTEAYDLARRLVSSAGPTGSAEDGSVYTSAARKVRVSVKIPDKSPEDLAPGWDTDLHINGHRRAVVLFTYIRRGCIQLVLDMVGPALKASPGINAAAGPAALAAPPPPPGAPAAYQVAADSDGQQAAGEASCSKPSGTPARAASGDGEGDMGGTSVGAALVGVAGDATTQPTGPFPEAVAGSGDGRGIHGQVLRAICSETLFAGRTLTLQVGAAASLVQLQPVEAGAASAAAGGGPGPCHGPMALDMVRPAPALPPDVLVQQQVVCTDDGWSAIEGALWLPWRRHTAPRRQREVLLGCSWDAAVGKCPGAAADQVARSPPGPALQVTVRQQGRFLPVSLAETAGGGGRAASTRRSLLAALAEGAVAVVVEPSGSAHTQEPERLHHVTASASLHGRGACLLAFTPASGDGLAQVELSRGGCHSAQAASVLLVSSPAVAFELEQLQAVARSGAGGGVDDSKGGVGCEGGQRGDWGQGAAPRPSMVTDVVRDFGSFLDIVPAIQAACGCCDDSTSGGVFAAADGVGSCSRQQPLFEWSVADVDCRGLRAPEASHVVVLQPRPNGCGAAGCGFMRHQRLQSGPAASAMAAASAARADTVGAAGGSGGAAAAASGAGDGLDMFQERRVLMLASVGCRMGLNLLRYFLSTGMAACATRVLDVLHHQLGVPPALLASGECCPERMTLLHHAARSGSFRTLASLAAWLEERGLEPGWCHACGAGGGLSPLHLLAVVPGAETACALTQVRWPAARHAWVSCRAAGMTPAHFADMARGAAAPPWWQRAVGAAPVSLVIGGVWRCGVAARRRFMPRHLARVCAGAVAPALSFMFPSLESSYVAWLDRRVAFMDHLFLAMYAAYCLSQAVKIGWAFFTEAVAGIILLVGRLSLLALQSPLRDVARWQLAMLCGSGSRCSSSSKEGRAEGGAGSGSASVCGAHSQGAAKLLLASRERTAVVMEVLRLAVMMMLAAGVMRMPYTWVRLVELRLDLLINPFIRPVAGQMRVLPSLMASAVALMGEATITVAIWQSAQSAAVGFTTAIARGCVSHGLGLSLTVLLQASARRRFLAELHRLRGGLPAGKTG